MSLILVVLEAGAWVLYIAGMIEMDVQIYPNNSHVQESFTLPKIVPPLSQRLSPPFINLDQ